MIHELAGAIGGAVGASRAAVDGGFIGKEHQIGQTGTTVRPALYIAAGISGAVQHRAGMEESAKIIAINRTRKPRSSRWRTTASSAIETGPR
jgi:electron transfer flavoprotein alpha subunit